MGPDRNKWNMCNRSFYRASVRGGAFSSVGSSFDAAADALIECEDAKSAWWQETLRRCDEAEQRREKLQDADAFFRSVRGRIATAKRVVSVK
jgi:hypothetical protein